jgi:hypothetical protein
MIEVMLDTPGVFRKNITVRNNGRSKINQGKKGKESASQKQRTLHPDFPPIKDRRCTKVLIQNETAKSVV